MADYQDILNDFKGQFEASGPEKYSEIENPSLRYDLAAQRGQTAAKGAGTATGIIAHNAAQAKADAEAAAKAKNDPSKYRREYNEGGGYNFFDSEGKPITAWQFATARQMPITAVLEGSYDPKDAEFMQLSRAMTQDISEGKYDLKKGLSVLANDFPQIFGGTGTGGAYETTSRQKGNETVSSYIENATGRKEKQYRNVASTLQQIQGANSYEEAKQIYNNFMVQNENKLGGAKSDLYKEIDSTLADSVYQLFRTKALNEKETGYTSNLF